jgi:hypothetical protein
MLLQPSLVRQPRSSAPVSALRSNSLPKSPHTKKQQRQQQQGHLHQAAEPDDSHQLDPAEAMAAGTAALAADGSLLLANGGYGTVPMHIFDSQQAGVAAGSRARRDDGGAGSSDEEEGQSAKRARAEARAAAGKGSK